MVSAALDEERALVNGSQQALADLERRGDHPY
jgi:hypothetical protein